METDQNTDDLQRRVLQSTLDEIATRQEDATDCCVICLESISEACEAIPCQHRNFDYLCLLSWLEQSPKCPLCKAVISQVRHGLDEPIAKTYTVAEPASEPRAPRIERRRLALPPHFRRRHSQLRPYPRQPRYGTTSSSPSDEIAKRRGCVSPQQILKTFSRARMWIRRELRVFSFLNPDADQTEPRPEVNSQRDAVDRRRANNAEFLLEYIIAILKSVDIMGSAGQAEEMISDFLGRDNTRLFLHELRAWLRSPYTKLADWDRAVQYDVSAPSSPRAESGGVGSSRQDQRQPKNVGAHMWDTPRIQGDFYRPQGRSQRPREVHRHEPYGRPHRD
ncbi:Zinc finger, RING-type [Fusarium oxysporum f. sp. vasinfectum]|nr:Zinc finger, RING-type [Fusarium oxysporum f. sp. vasinfectum]